MMMGKSTPRLELTFLSPAPFQTLSTAGKPSWTTGETPFSPGRGWRQRARSSVRNCRPFSG